MSNSISRTFAAKFMNVAFKGDELSEVENFKLQIVRDGLPMPIGEETDEEGNVYPITTFMQKNIHFTKLNNFVKQVNAITAGCDVCSLKTDLFTIKFKGGKFAIKVEKFLSEITEGYFRNKTGMPFVDNESPQFEAVMENFVSAFVGNQTSVLNYIALVDVFNKDNNDALRQISKYLIIDKDDNTLKVDDKLIELIEGTDESAQ